MNLKSGLLASAASAAVLALASPVQAGGYVTIFGGWNITDDIKSLAGSNGDVLTSFSTTVNHDTGGGGHPHTFTFNFTAPSTFFNSGAAAEDGWVIGAAVGGDLSQIIPGLRGEFEASYRRNNLGAAAAAAAAADTDTAQQFFSAPVVIDHSCGITPLAPLVVTNPPPAPCQATGPGGSGTYGFRDTFSTSNAFASGSGSIRTFALMANVWYDLPVEGFTPYIGGGIGYASNEVEHGLVMNGTGGDFAWQLGAGVNFPLTEKMSLGVGYRYMDAGEVELVRSPALATGNLLVTDVHEVKHQSVQVNLTFALGN
jgi:opacity protein-like surface antigen